MADGLAMEAHRGSPSAAKFDAYQPAIVCGSYFYRSEHGLEILQRT